MTCRASSPLVRRLRRAPAAAALALLAGPACGVPEAGPPPWSDWSRLEMKARSGLFRGQVEFRWTAAPEGARLEVTSVARLLGATVARYTAATRFDAAGRVREYRSTTRKHGRRFAFGERAYTVEKLRPHGDSTAPLEAWDVVSRAEFDYPQAGTGLPVPVLDYYGMLLRLHEQRLSAPGDEVTVLVATQRGPRSYRMRVTEARTGQREFTRWPSGSRTSSRVRELRLTIAPEDPATRESFLNMEGETELWVEAESKTLLEIGGQMPHAGRVRLTLSAIG
jgi:hypothetical protein